MATASLLLGAASIFTILSVFLPFILGGLAILLALLSKGYGRKMLTQAKIGLACGIGGFCITAVICVVSVGALLSDPEKLISFGRQYDAMMENTYGQSTEELYGESFEDIMRQYAEILHN